MIKQTNLSFNTDKPLKTLDAFKTKPFFVLMYLLVCITDCVHFPLEDPSMLRKL